MLAAWIAPAEASGQEGCRYVPPGNDQLNSIQTPQGDRVTYIKNPHFSCDGGDVEILADSAVAYSAQAMSQLIGRVRYRDRTRELRADNARYFSEVGRVQAQGNLLVTNTEDGSQIRNGDLVYLRQTDRREQEEMTVVTWSDGLRPVATFTPESNDSVLDAEPPTSYTVVGDRIVLRGSEYFASNGNVEIQRDSLFAYADSAEYTQASELLFLVGSSRVVSGGYTLVGRTITMGTSTEEANVIEAIRDGLLTGDDLVLTAPHITLHVVDGAVERLVAVPLSGDLLGPEPDSAEVARPVAVAEDVELSGDSLDLIAPAGILEQIVAAGSARSVSHARDSLNVEALLPIARYDWLDGDTIVVSLIPVADSLATTADDPEVQVDRIVARVGARSLYRLPPEDSTAQIGIDPPAVHYVQGDQITLVMANGEVEAMEVVGQTRGIHLEPLGPSADSTTAVPDTTAITMSLDSSSGPVRRPAERGPAAPRPPAFILSNRPSVSTIETWTTRR